MPGERAPNAGEDAMKRALISYLLHECQPDHGDVFNWVDDHADEIVRVMRAAYERGLNSIAER